ncbi:phosphate metabolism protein 7, partial [Linderina pennispora]
KRSPAIGVGPLAWISAALSVSDDKVIERVGLDSYMFLRSIRAMFFMFSVLSFLSVVTILPVNITAGGTATGLAVLSIGNVPPQSSKLWVHIVFFGVFVIWVMWSIFGELKVYTRLRAWWLMRPEHTSTVGASTILVSTLPETMLESDARIKQTFNMFPGGVRQVFVNRNVETLSKAVEKRDKYANKLEGLLTKYAVQCEKAQKLVEKKGGEYKEPKRPMMRESSVPFKGPKIDAINFYSTQIAELNLTIADLQKDASQFKKQSSAFVLFNKQIAAHMAAQSVLDYKPFSMDNVSFDVNPDDIIWSNLNMNPYDRQMRAYMSFGITIGLTITWMILTAFVTSLVSMENLRKYKPFENIPDTKWLSLFQGFVPSIVIAVLMSLLPRILRLLLKLEGTRTMSEINLRLLHRFYFFQVWNVYFITIFANGILEVAEKVAGNPALIVDEIATQVPKTATAIITYVLLLAFSGAAKELLQGVSLALRYVLPMILAKTPRSISNAEKPSEFDWGTNIPTHTLIFLMGFSYCFIAPIVNCFVAVYFGLYFVVYRYQFLYVYNDANWITGGLSFPKFIKQLLVGVYISEVYMVLMMIAKIKGGGAEAIVRIVFAALILAGTVVAHMYINNAYMPILTYLPIRRAAEVEENPKLALEFPDVYADASASLDTLDSKKPATAESRRRRHLYAIFGTLIPISLIDYIIRKVPSLIPSPITDALSPSPHRVSDEEISTEHKVSAEKPATASGSDKPGSIKNAPFTMPEPHHYTGTADEKRASESSNIFSIDSGAAPVAPATLPIEENQPEIYHSAISDHSATGLRQRRPASNFASANSNHRKSAMADNRLQADADENILTKAFSNPSLLAKSTCILWVPMDNNRRCQDLYDEVLRDGNGTIQIVTEGTWITEKCHVKADVEFGMEELDAIDEEPVVDGHGLSAPSATTATMPMPMPMASNQQ